jgi:hypothetical protein
VRLIHITFSCPISDRLLLYFSLVLETLNEALAGEPGRKCFRMVGGVLVERTVKDVVPALAINRENVRARAPCLRSCLCRRTDPKGGRRPHGAVQDEGGGFRLVQARVSDPSCAGLGPLLRSHCIKFWCIS